MPIQSTSANARNLSIEYLATNALTADPRNARKHPQRQLARLKAVINELGFNNPILVDERLGVIAGHARLEAAKALGMQKVPCVRLSHLSEAQKTALAIADNKLGDMSYFDPELLAKQLADLCAIDFAIELTGFETAEVDILLEPPRISATDNADIFTEPDLSATPVSQTGDLWMLNEHRLLCGNALEVDAYAHLLGSQLADMVFTDVPYNVPTHGHVSGLGRSTHREFAMASGEMSRDQQPHRPGQGSAQPQDRSCCRGRDHSRHAAVARGRPYRTFAPRRWLDPPQLARHRHSRRGDRNWERQDPRPACSRCPTL